MLSEGGSAERRVLSDSSKSELDRLRTWYVECLSTAMLKLQSAAERTLKKIDAEGINGYYSGNSDVHRYTADAWRASLALCELRRLEDKLLEEVKTKPEKKTKKKKGKKKNEDRK